MERARKGKRRTIAGKAYDTSPHYEPSDFVSCVVFVPTPNPCNGGWTARQRMHYSKEQRERTLQALRAYPDSLKGKFAAGCTITICRLSSKNVDKLNLAACLKHVIDAIAMWILGGTPGERDDDPKLEWIIEQGKAKKGEQSVRVLIEPRMEK